LPWATRIKKGNQMISPQKINILLSPSEIEKILKKKSKELGVSPQHIKTVKIKVIKKYTDWRSFSVVLFYSFDKKRIVGTANSDGKKEYAFKINKLIFKHFSKTHPKNISISKPYCYIKGLGLFLREYLKGENLGEILKKKGEIKILHIKRIAELLAFLQSIKTSQSFIKRGTDFYDIEKNIKILRQRKIKESAIISKRFQKIKRLIKGYERKKTKKVLVHGDFNPYNLFFEKNRIKIADFGSIHIGERVSDLAALFSHLETSLDFNISKKQRISFENLLLKYYQKLTKEFDAFEIEKLKVYRAYFSLLILSHIMVWGGKPQRIQAGKKLKHINIV